MAIVSSASTLCLSPWRASAMDMYKGELPPGTRNALIASSPINVPQCWSPCQYHEVISFLCGRFLGAVTVFFVMLNVFGISVAQDMGTHLWGSPASLCVRADLATHPGHQHPWADWHHLHRLVAGHCSSCQWARRATSRSYRISCKPPKSLQLFYTGFGVLLVAYGGHNISFEVMDGMNVPKKYRWVGFVSFLYIFTLTVPHSTAVQLTYPTNNAKYGNVYGALPHTWGMNISIFLIILHQICAFIYYNAPLFYVWEKLWGIHEKSLWIRIPSRLPITLLCWLVGIAFPFYGTLNSVIGALCGPIVAFAMPAFAFNITYWKKKSRQEVALSPFRWMIKYFGWNVIFVFNWFIIAIYVVNGTGFALVYSIKTFVQAVHQYKFFAGVLPVLSNNSTW